LCADFAASRRFYAAVLAVFGRELVELMPSLVYADELCLSPARGGRTSGVHLPVQTAPRAQVERLYPPAMSPRGPGNGKPGQRPYHPGYYAAFVLDPDGNNVEAVHHGEAVRSAESVVIRPSSPTPVG